MFWFDLVLAFFLYKCITKVLNTIGFKFSGEIRYELKRENVK